MLLYSSSHLKRTNMKKYELTGTYALYHERGVQHKLYRIRALIDFNDVKANDIGGFIKSEANLSQEGDCWVYDRACVFDNAVIKDNAQVRSNSRIKGNAVVKDNAVIYSSYIVENAVVGKDAAITDQQIGNLESLLMFCNT